MENELLRRDYAKLSDPEKSLSAGRPDVLITTEGLFGDEDDESEPPSLRAVARSDSANQAPVTYVNRGDYSPILCDTPRAHTPDSSVSDESMRSNYENATPPESPSKSDSPAAAATAAQISALSLKAERNDDRNVNRRGRANATPLPATVSKRAASTELTRPAGGHSPAARWLRDTQSSTPKNSRQPRTRRQRGTKSASKGTPSPLAQNSSPDVDHYGSTTHPTDVAQPAATHSSQPIARDSGYGSLPPSRANTFQQLPPKLHTLAPNFKRAPTLPKLTEDPITSSDHKPPKIAPRIPHAKQDHVQMIREPESSPISKDQLAAEVKGIYAGLVMVEAKCINIDNAQAADPNTELGREQWQALIALHRTLLYEHHDFLMATQHPSATPALQALAMKYSMPARMWKHGIHAFLEVLRHRRPQSQDYMLAFIYLAYQMMALLYETVPSFTDTWIECLGDIARYRMAIEEEKEPHLIWGGVACRWYSLAADRHSTTGRLYHHLGILERPGLPKFFLYGKSLTCVIPFQNARDSLATLCGQLNQDDKMMRQRSSTVEVQLLTFHAKLFLESVDANAEDQQSNDVLRLSVQLGSQPASKFHDIGVELVVTNIAFLLQLGLETNRLWQLFGHAIVAATYAARPSATSSATAGSLASPSKSPALSSVATTFASSQVYDLFFGVSNIILKHRMDAQQLHHALPAIHTTVVWIYGISVLQMRLHDNDGVNTAGPLLELFRFDWGGLSECLNVLGKSVPSSARLIDLALKGDFPIPTRKEHTKPLPEDFSMRGLVWTQFYFPSHWFDEHIDDDGGRNIETSITQTSRAERLQWLGLWLAFNTEYLDFDSTSRTFSTTMVTPALSLNSDETELVGSSTDLTIDDSTPQTWSSAMSTHSDSDGYTVVAPLKAKPARSKSDVVSKPSKVRLDDARVKMVGEEQMWAE